MSLVTLPESILGSNTGNDGWLFCCGYARLLGLQPGIVHVATWGMLWCRESVMGVRCFFMKVYVVELAG